MRRSFVFLLLAFPTLAFCSPLSYYGKWLERNATRSGTIVIDMIERGEGRITGNITITGTDDCTEAIAFEGTLRGEQGVFASTAPIVCGHGGVLRGEIVRRGNDQYEGNFAYIFLQQHFMAGEFRLAPATR